MMAKFQPIQIEEVRDDYIPYNVNSPKMLYVTTKFPQSDSYRPLYPGRLVQLSQLARDGKYYNSIHVVDDVCGMRITLLPVPRQRYNLTYGYTQETIDKKLRLTDSWHWGYGDGAGFLIPL
jgi:hypothetical protein